MVLKGKNYNLYIAKKQINSCLIYIGGKNMDFLKDEGGQGAAEYILLFGGVIVIAVAALIIYRAYFSNSGGLSSSSDIQSVRGSVPK